MCNWNSVSFLLAVFLNRDFMCFCNFVYLNAWLSLVYLMNWLDCIYQLWWHHYWVMSKKTVDLRWSNINHISDCNVWSCQKVPETVPVVVAPDSGVFTTHFSSLVQPTSGRIKNIYIMEKFLIFKKTKEINFYVIDYILICHKIKAYTNLKKKIP